MKRKLMFASDYQEGACPSILKRMEETNDIPMPGYGKDGICSHAKEQIRKACNCPNAEVEFLLGGTQTNATVIDALLHSYQGVLAADSGHVNVHEAGAIEFGGHKVLSLQGTKGKITAAQIGQSLMDFQNDENCDHMVMPGMVYISQPTEYGTLYNLKELSEIHNVCMQNGIPLFVDGARLAYALASPDNDVTLPDLARLCDVLYIGGTKCGALFGEAVVVPDPSLIPHFFTIIKQHGALLAKGWLLGIQFDELFRNDLYLHIGETAIRYASRIKNALVKNHYQLYFDSPTNQIFFIIDNEKMASLEENVAFGFGEKYDDRHSVIRFATSWSTEEKDVDALCHLLASI
ncbi:MAG: threonine aldolase family protein [Bilifractor sp.]